MQLLVTGGTGYLGSCLVEALSKKFSVRLLARDKTNTASLERLNHVQVVWGDVRDRPSLQKALQGCDAVFHLAALVKQWVPQASLFHEVNVEGFRNLAEASWDAGIRRFLYTSSLFALGPTDPTGGNRTFHTAYERSKAEALEVARAYQKKGHPLVTLIPTVLYGPGRWTEGNHISLMLKELLERKFRGYFDGGRWRWNFAYVRDVAEGHRLALEGGRVGEEYLLGGETVSLREFFTLASELAGCPVPKREIPISFLQGYAVFQEVLAHLFRREPSLTKGSLAMYRHDWVFSDEKARRDLGYTPTPFREALAATIGWLKETI
ncbi:MAG: NAD-dependent epimerase/dehydratase family protein [Candidatus Omnitrophica bacterium]|nr:NAD-dependent epimerase/dehydratase family protein [Candidatus Omnitrophota bacterium]